MISHYNDIVIKNKLFIDFVGELIKDQPNLDFVFSKDMLDKINGVKPKAGIQSRLLSASELANINARNNIATQPSDIDASDLIKIVSTIFVLVKYFNFDKKIIENSKVMEYYDRLIKKHEMNATKDGFTEIIEDLIPIVVKLLK